MRVLASNFEDPLLGQYSSVANAAHVLCGPSQIPRYLFCETTDLASFAAMLLATAMGAGFPSPLE